MIFVKKITHKNLVEIYPLGYNDIAFRIVFQEIYTTAGSTGPAKYQLCPKFDPPPQKRGVIFFIFSPGHGV